MVTIKYKAIDSEGNALSVFDMFRNVYNQEQKETLFIPAGVEDFPIAFTLPMGFKYDMSSGAEMPEIDHMEFDVVEVVEVDYEDLKDHFTPGEPEIRENHIYLYVKFDQEIGDTYSSLYPNYTLLGYTNDEVTAICCVNYFPYGSTSFSVNYAKENYDGSLLFYNSVPNDPVDKWELYLGCIGGQQ